MPNVKKSPAFGMLQQLVDSLYEDDDAPYMEQLNEEAAFKVSKMDVELAAEAADIPQELLRIVKMLPPGEYTRGKLCMQLNSAIVGHAWGQVYGTVS